MRQPRLVELLRPKPTLPERGEHAYDASERGEDWGILPGFHMVNGEWRDTSPEAETCILQTMGATSEWRRDRERLAPRVIEWGTKVNLGRHWIVITENGEQVEGENQLPFDLPTGYHQLFLEDEPAQSLIVRPSACPSFATTWEWGWVVQLYATRSSKSWGIGDLGDLAMFGEMAGQKGARVALLNPLHAPLPGLPQESSPYYPSSREFRNPLFLRIEDVPGAVDILEDLDVLSAQGRRLNTDPRIDRNAVWAAKMAALEAIWKHTSPSPAFMVYAERAGQALARYATFCAISEVHGRSWYGWPEALKRPDNPEVDRFARDHADRVAFHAWLQWLCEMQLNAAAEKLSIMQDLAVGVDPQGADAWLWQDVFAMGVRVGAPPDFHNLEGQDWGAPPFDPWRLRALDYEPFIRMIRANLRVNGGVRIDHVMGLFRIYWIPDGMHASQGAYVSYPWEDLLGIVALEAQRCGALVIGEDLGTVEDSVREQLSRHCIASYKLAWFEPGAPSAYPRAAFAAATTHDLPTTTGVWTDEDLHVQQSIGLTTDPSFFSGIRQRIMVETGLMPDASAEDFTDAVHRYVASGNAAIAAATLEDAVGVSNRPNYPGTTSEYPNWSVALPVTLDELSTHEGFVRTSTIMTAGREEAEAQRDALERSGEIG